MYKCSCSDFFIRATICKHIHYLCLNTGKELDCNPISVYKESKENIELCLSQLNSEMTNKNHIQEKLCNELSSLSAKVRTSEFANLNDEVLSQMLAHIRNANNLFDLKPMSLEQFIPTSSESSNKHLVKQLSFRSTKRKHSVKWLSKNPDKTEVKVINDI